MISRLVAGVLMSAVIAMIAPVAANAAAGSCSKPLVRGIPKRAIAAPSGSEVMARLVNTRGSERDAAVTEQVLSGNVPSFLRILTPVTLPGILADGKKIDVTICVTPEYLAVGNDRDFVRVPMGLPAAVRIADEMGFLLPTTKMVDAIYSQANVHLKPSPMKPTSQMESTTYLLQHDETIDGQRAQQGQSLKFLTAGQKKDLVLSNRLRSKPGRVAIYGWHRINGKPIQPLSTVHGERYADYSHGVRLVSQTAFIDGKPTKLKDILQDRQLAAIVNSEGPIQDIDGLVRALH